MENIIKINRDDRYSKIVDAVGDLLREGRAKVSSAVNSTMLQTYWTIGQYIIEAEQDGKNRAGYGKALIDRLSRDLTLRYGKGFNRSNLQYMRKLYLEFPICTTLSRILSWSHYVEILKSDDPLEISFYVAQCENEMWSVRELQRQKKSMLFHRLALSRDREGIVELSRSGVEIRDAKDIVKDPYVLEFLDIPQPDKLLESDLEAQIIDNLQRFLLELGKGFAFIGRQYRISIGGRHFYVDLVFYHRILKCFVLIDLKRGEIEHNDVGQMNLYINYFRNEENCEGDNEPIGIILGAEKNNVLIEYALENITNQLFVSKYQLYLPNKESLQREVQKILEQE